MLRPLFRDRSHRFSVQAFRYAIAGGTAFVVDFAALFILTEFAGINYLISAALAFFLGLITNYIISVAWVFSRRVFVNERHEFFIFTVIGIIGLALNELFLWYFTEEMNRHYLISKLIAAVIVFAWNFLGKKFILFR